MTPLERLAKQRDDQQVAINKRKRDKAVVESKIRAQEKALRKKREAALGALAYAAGLHGEDDAVLAVEFRRVADMLSLDRGHEPPVDELQGRANREPSAPELENNVEKPR